MDASVFVPLLQCRIERFTYDFILKSGEIFMAEGNCTDMTGAIKYVSAVDSDVQSIITWTAGKRDTVYIRRGGTWRAER